MAWVLLEVIRPMERLDDIGEDVSKNVSGAKLVAVVQSGDKKELMKKV